MSYKYVGVYRIIYRCGWSVDIIYLDFSNGFDKAPHRRLLLKLKVHGIGGRVLDFIERRQRVVLNGLASDWTDVWSGLPQGSVLSPFLFVIYINDIDQDLHSRLLKFADDTKLFGVVRSVEEVEKIREDFRVDIDVRLIVSDFVKWRLIESLFCQRISNII